MSGVLSKTKSVIPLRRLHSKVGANGGRVYFTQDVDDIDTDDRRSVFIPAELWVDLGEPTEITVTIEPGDQLNVEAV